MTMRLPVVLIIEDVVATQRVIAASLREIDAEFHYARDGWEAIELASELLPDVIVLDLALPGLTGDKVLQELRSDDRTRAIPVLVVTAHGQSGMAHSVISQGADGFMEKPFVPRELHDAVEELLAGGSR